MRAKKHVVVLSGGMSAEHEVSLNSGAMVYKHLDQNVYKVSSVVITRDGEWVFPHRRGDSLEIHDALGELYRMTPDCVFIALHGPYGEDGRLQGMLDYLGIQYTGSGCAASAIAMDKPQSKALVEHGGVLVAKHLAFTSRDWKANAAEITKRVSAEIGFPCVVKSPRLGSSLGLAIPKRVEDFSDGVADVLKFGYAFMVERFIAGREITCGVLDVEEDAPPFALPVTEIRPKGDTFFDYHAKYTPGASEEITPAPIPDEIRDAVQRAAVRAHEIVGCRGISRSDMIWDGNRVFWLEINTVPGLTETSLVPQGAAAAGISLTELFGKLVDAVLL